MNILPIQYHLEIYESGSTDPLASFSASTPFQSIAAGDFINVGVIPGWGKKLKADEGLKVTSVEHLIWDVSGTHIGHKIMVRAKLAKV